MNKLSNFHLRTIKSPRSSGKYFQKKQAAKPKKGGRFMEGTRSEALPFKFDFQLNRSWSRKFFPLIEAPLERALSFPRLNSMYAR